MEGARELELLGVSRVGRDTDAMSESGTRSGALGLGQRSISPPAGILARALTPHVLGAHVLRTRPLGAYGEIA